MIERLLPYFKGYERQAMLAPLSVAMETVCELILPLLMAGIIDDGILAGNMNIILRTGILMVVISLLSLLGGILAARFTAQAAQGVGANLRQAQFDKVNQFSFADIDRFSSASLITRMTNDVTRIQMVVSICLRMLIRSSVMMIVAVVVSMSIDRTLASYVFMIIPVVGVVLLLLMKICNPLFKKFQKAFDDLNHSIQENLIAIRVVKAFVREGHEKNKFQKANDNLTNTGLDAIMKVLFMSPVLSMGISLATVVILYQGGIRVLDGRLEVGQLSSLLTYIFNILFSVMMVGMALLQYTRAKASADRIFEVLDAVPSVRDKEPEPAAQAAEQQPEPIRSQPAPEAAGEEEAPEEEEEEYSVLELMAMAVGYNKRSWGTGFHKNSELDKPAIEKPDFLDKSKPDQPEQTIPVPAAQPAEPAIDFDALPTRGKVEFRNVTFKYEQSGSGDDVLRDISFTAQPGQVVAIVGGTGVGKSTLVNLIPRFYDVTGGQVLVDGVDVRDYPLQVLRKKVGMVLQKNVLFTGTIRENLLWGDPEASEEAMIQAAKDAQAYDFIMERPDGFDTYIEQGGVNVSGGQKQRLCIARAMLRKPQILILDDSTSAVDSATEARIRQSFRDNLMDTTVILIAQRISSVRDADMILVLEDDSLAAMGTHDQLMATSPVYQEIYNSQQEGVNQNG